MAVGVTLSPRLHLVQRPSPSWALASLCMCTKSRDDWRSPSSKLLSTGTGTYVRVPGSFTLLAYASDQAMHMLTLA